MKKVLGLTILVVVGLLMGSAAFAQETIDISVRCVGGEIDRWRCENFAAVEEQVEAELGISLNLTLTHDAKAWADYKNEFLLAAQAGEAPDIILSGHEDVGAWAPAGFIIPLDDLIAQHSEFEDIVPTLWESQSWDGQVWAIPQDSEARPIFFSRLLLADLGWSEEEIASLPERVRMGEFTFEDMIATAEQAVAEGVVESGYGFYHRPSIGFDWLPYYLGHGGEIMIEDGTLVFDTEAALGAYELIASFAARGVTRPDMIGYDWTQMYTEVAPADQVLFYQGGTWQWADWAVNYIADLGGNDYLLENMGLMLFPAMTEEEGPLTLTHPLSYMISSSSEHPEVAMALLAAVTTVEANNRHAIESFHLGILNAQVEAEPYKSHPVLSTAHYMLDYTRSAPNHPSYSAWANAYWLGITAAHTGEATPEEAVQLAVETLQNELGDGITIR